MIKSALVSILLFGQLFSFYDITVKSCSGSDILFSDFKGKMVLVVNVASEHALSDQIADLEVLYKKYQSGLVVVAVPSNSFGNEPDTGPEVCHKLRRKYDCSFIITDRSEVIGEKRIRLYQWIGAKEMNGLADIPIYEDFQKILVNGEGNVVGIYASAEPVLGGDIEAAIAGN